MRRRGFLLALVALAAAGSAVAANPRQNGVPKLLFPVAGAATYEDDFGDPRGDGPPHPGNDLLATKKTPVIAVESGKVKFWTSSATAGCMLYLYGDSGTTYEYIHLNNDRTMRNDNRGKCVAGTAYARGLKDGARVTAGQQIGYVGDSGDANGIHPHLHFEVHPNGGDAVDPYPYLQSAQHLLFFAKLGTPFTLALKGTVVGSTDTSLTVQLSSLQGYPMRLSLKGLTQTLTLTVPETAVVLPPRSRRLSADVGETVTVWTQPALTSLKAMLGSDGALDAALVQLSA